MANETLDMVRSIARQVEKAHDLSIALGYVRRVDETDQKTLERLIKIYIDLCQILRENNVYPEEWNYGFKTDIIGPLRKLIDARN